MAIALAADLAGRVRLGVFVLEGVTVRDGDPALAAEVDGYCAELRAKYGGRQERRGARRGRRADPLQGPRPRPHEDAAFERSPPAPCPQGRAALPHQHPRGRPQPELAPLPTAVWPLRPRPGPPPDRASTRCFGRELRGHPEGGRKRRRAPRAGRRRRAVRQPDVGLGPHHDHDGHHQRAGRASMPRRRTPRPVWPPCSTLRPRPSSATAEARRRFGRCSPSVRAQAGPASQRRGSKWAGSTSGWAL